MTNSSFFKGLICHFLILSIAFQSTIVAASQSKESSSDKIAKDYQKDYDKLKNGEKTGKVEKTSDGQGHEHLHAEFKDKDGNIREYDFDRNVKVGVTAGERSFAMRDERHVSVRDIPAPREHDLKDASTSQKNAINTKSDEDHIKDFTQHVHEAKEDDSHEKRQARHDLETVTDMLTATSVEGTQVHRHWVGRSDSAERSIDQERIEFSPPRRDAVISAGPEFTRLPELPPIDFDAAEKELQGQMANAARVSESNRSEASATDAAVSGALADEVVRASPEVGTRIKAFIEAHMETIRAGSEVIIDIAMIGFPVANLGWGIANLTSMALTGKTVMGTAANSPLDYGLVTIGAILPALTAGKIAKLFKERPLVATTLETIRTTGVATEDTGVVLFDTTSKISNPLPKNGRFARVVPRSIAEEIVKGKSTLATDPLNAFITSADEITDLKNSSEIAEKLSLYEDPEATTLRSLDNHVIIEFELKNQIENKLREPTVADVLGRESGWIPGGRTRGGAREWLVDSDLPLRHGIKNIRIREIPR